MPSSTATGAVERAPLPNVGRLLLDQVRYQAQLMLAGGRTFVIGVGLPVILLITSSSGHDRISALAVASHAVFGLTLTAWNIHGVRLVAARESGILKRWRSTPLPRSCYFLARILATTLVAVLAAAITVLASVLLYNTSLTVSAALVLLLVFVLGAAAWAAAATALAGAVKTLDAAAPTMMLVYFPAMIISGVLGVIHEPHWLHTLASWLPAEPVIDAATRALRHAPGVALVSAHDLIVLAAWVIGGLALATVTFRWEPSRPTRGRGGRLGA